MLGRLGNPYRTVALDARARGKPDKSADYSFADALKDVGHVIQATGLHRPLLVGWSYGATLPDR